MNCPYCARAIEEEAILCPSCRSDLALLKPLLIRLSKAEESATNTNTLLRMFLEQTTTEVYMLPVIALIGSLLLTFSFTFFSWEPWAGDRFDFLWHSLAIAAPFFMSFALALSSNRVRPSSYLLFGFVAGAAGFAELMLIYALCTLSEALKKNVPYVTPPLWLVSLVLYPISGALLAYSGGTLGRVWKRKYRPQDPAAVLYTTYPDFQLLKVLTTIAPFAGIISAIITVMAQPKQH